MKPWEQDEIVGGTAGVDSGAPWEQDEIVGAEQSDGVGAGGAASFVNKAMAETAGAPVDIMTGALNLIPGVDIEAPFLGSDHIKRVLGALRYGSPDQPIHERAPLFVFPEGEAETIPEHIGQVMGETAAFLLPAAKGAQMLSKGTKVLNKVSKAVFSSMVKHPYLTMTSEVTGAIGAGTGRGVADQKDMGGAGSTATEIAGGLVGGLAPTAVLHAPTLVALRAGKNVLNKISLPFTEKGAKYRAGKFVKSQVVDPEKTIETLSKETISDIPPAVVAGEKKLTGLYKSLVGQDPLTDSESIETIGKSIVELEKEMRKLGYGNADLLAEVTEKRVAAIELDIDKRVMGSMDNARKKLDALPVAQRKSAESRIVRDEIEKTMASEKVRVDEKWADVDKDAVVGVENTKTAYADVLSELAQAQHGDVPAVLKKSFILAEGKGSVDATTIKEMQGLRTKLLENSRVARKNGQMNRARIASDMADAVLDDMGLASQVKSPEAKTLQVAIAATRRFKDRFHSGTMGNILGLSKSGAPSIDPSLTLDISIGRAGQKGALDIGKIVETPEAIEATRRYLARSFTDFSVDQTTGAVKPLKAEKWIRNNEDILDSFPEIKSQLTDITSSQQLASDTKLKMGARKKALRDPKISAAASFLNAADMDRTVKNILSSPNQAFVARDLVKKAKFDTSGDALVGLRGAFVDHMLEKSSIGSFNELGERTLSGSTILNFLKKNKASVYQVFDAEQVVRMRKIGTELAKIEAFEKSSRGSAEVDMQDLASSAMKMFSRVGGAQVGRWVAGMTGGGTVQTPGIFSDRFATFANFLSKDRAFQMIHDAIISKDKGLLEALLLPIDNPASAAGKKNIKELNSKMNAWLLSTGKRVMEDVEGDR